MQGICVRDRSVPAGRSHFLIAYPSLYVLLSGCEGIVGHCQQDFDTDTYLSGVYLYVTSVPFCIMSFDPVASPGIGTQSVHEPDEDFISTSSTTNAIQSI